MAVIDSRVIRHHGAHAHDLTSLRESAPSLNAPLAPSSATTTPRLNHGTMAASEYGSDVDIPSIISLSDYGSEIGLEDIDDDTILADVLDTINKQGTNEKSRVLPSIEFEEGELEDEEQDVDGVVQIHRPTMLRMAKGRRSIDTQRDIQSSPMRERQAREVEYDERSRRAWSVPIEEPLSAPSAAYSALRSKSHTNRSQSNRPSTQTPQVVDSVDNDARSPLERFRTKPKKPLSVTDLVSPAWCELQYFYTLSKFGRKPWTQAMRTGTKIHEELERHVHTTVPIQVQSKEDRFGLRIWNAISGLRCLRETGLTRELEVWGVLEGQVVNGVIDEISYQCPDTAFEEQTERSRAAKSGGVLPLPLGQVGIAEAFAKATHPQADESAWISSSEPERQVYITDVKTRSVCSVPAGASLRPTWMQLMLYRKLLERLSLNTVDAEVIFVRYDLRPLEPFTELFMHELDSIGPDNHAANYPNLFSLWSLLTTEMQSTLGLTRISPILRAEFRFAKTGDVIGSALTVYEPEIIDSYIAEEMAWWKGSREAKGVEVEEAFKCRICDFAEACSWRKTKVEEAIEKSRLRRQAREKSRV